MLGEWFDIENTLEVAHTGMTRYPQYVSFVIQVGMYIRNYARVRVTSESSMDVFEMPFALLTFMSFVAITPAWMWFISSYPPAQNLRLASTFIVNLTFPALSALALASWLEGGARA